MGHLSTSDRVTTTQVAPPSHGGSNSEALAHQDKTPNGGGVVSDKSCLNQSDRKIDPIAAVVSSSSSSSSQNGGADLANIIHNNNVVNDILNVASSKSSRIVVPLDKTNLEEYTKDFRGDKFLGIQFKAPFKWDKIIQISLLHFVFLYSFAVYPVPKVSLWSTLFAFFTGGLAGFGVTGGAHRLWTHRSFKANTPLRAILMCCFSLSGQNTLYDWVRDHRVHHKFSETDADPHNSNRGFFFAHVGWLMMHKHPEVLRRGRQIDMSDILNDPVVQFHQKHFIALKLMLCFVIPTLIPMYCWGEEFWLAFATQCIFRYVFSLNFTWSVNSAAHMWGYRPFDTRINPSENLLVSIFAMGEGWHNYHHVFPWDYKAAELGQYSVNLTTMYLDMFAKLGWAYDRKQPSKDLVRRTIEKYGDGTHPVHGHHHHEEVPAPNDGESYDENLNVKKE